MFYHCLCCTGAPWCGGAEHIPSVIGARGGLNHSQVVNSFATDFIIELSQKTWVKMCWNPCPLLAQVNILTFCALGPDLSFYKPENIFMEFLHVCLSCYLVLGVDWLDFGFQRVKGQGQIFQPMFNPNPGNYMPVIITVTHKYRMDRCRFHLKCRQSWLNQQYSTLHSCF